MVLFILYIFEERANEILVLTVSGEQTDSGENKTIS